MTAVTERPDRRVRPATGPGSVRNVLVDAANRAAGARRAAGVTATTVRVAGLCAWSRCRRPFDVAHDVRNREGWPTTCSTRCAKRVIRQRNTARNNARRRAESEHAAAAAAALCWMCWTADRRDGIAVCGRCLAAGADNAERMCRGKRRLGMDAAIDRAAAISLTQGSELMAYWCPVCDWWHVGNEGIKAVRKYRTLSATLWAASLPPHVLDAKVREFDTTSNREEWDAGR